VASTHAPSLSPPGAPGADHEWHRKLLATPAYANNLKLLELLSNPPLVEGGRYAINSWSFKTARALCPYHTEVEITEILTELTRGTYRDPARCIARAAAKVKVKGSQVASGGFRRAGNRNYPSAEKVIVDEVARANIFAESFRTMGDLMKSSPTPVEGDEERPIISTEDCLGLLYKEGH
jgi:hypothetical protein